MKKEINYYVIGGQYFNYCYGGTKTLIEAKRLATKNEEYWDNWAGWHKPAIFSKENCDANGNPKYGALAAAFWDKWNKRWEENYELGN